MWFAYKRDEETPGRIIRVSAQSISEEERFDHVFICPVCGECTFYVKRFGTPEEKGYRPPHFKHQKKDLCDTDVCDLRVETHDTDTYISQKVRTPLFLRASKDGKFTLSAGFSSANKELLQKLWNSNFRKIQIRTRNGICGSTSIKALIANGETGFIDLSEPVFKQSHAQLVAVTQDGKAQQAFKLNEAWEEFLDWFGNPACTGALFSCESGSAGQKVMAGDFVKGGEKYLLMLKETGWNRKSLLNRTLPQMQRVGYVSFAKGAAYSVFRVKLPQSNCTKKDDYNALAAYMQESFGVVLCDSTPDFEPVWPPAAKKANTFLVEKLSDNKEAIISIDGLAFEDTVYIHRTTDESVECSKGSAGLLPIAFIPLTSMLQPVSCDPAIESNRQSFRIGALRSLLVPIFYVQQVGTETLWNATENHPLLLPENPAGFELRSNCGFTLYGEDRDMHVSAGEKYYLLPKKDRYLVITDPGQIIVLHTIKPRVKTRKTVQNKYQKKYRGKYSKERN